MPSPYASIHQEMTADFRKAKFIGRECATGITWRSPVLPAPCFRREFTVNETPQTAQIRFCGLGYGELFLDGEKIGDEVLSPLVSVYDRRTGYRCYEPGTKLTAGTHTWAVRLGNGWYNCHTADVWHFDKVSWRDAPKMWFELELDGCVVLTSDESWKVGTGGIRFDGLRNGEFFDANLEPEGWMQNGFDDSEWETAYLVAPPGGRLVEQTAPPCRVLRRVEPLTLRTGESEWIVDFGENLTGWCAIEVEAAPGTEFVIRHFECADAEGLPEDPGIKHLAEFVLSGEFQTDRYIAAGKGIESWHPRFTYHGFRYARITASGRGKLRSVQAEAVASAMPRIGDYHCSDPDFMRLKECAVRSYSGNFTGIPTDCPQREKNGWTGDAHLAAGTGLYFFDGMDSYCHWLDIICDTQRPDGQLSSIAPNGGGWGFNCASGPVWDCALIRIPYEIYLHTGDRKVLTRYYPNMLRYLEYLPSRTLRNGLINFGLADWCAPNCIGGHVDCRFASTAYYAHMFDLAARIAAILGLPDDHAALSKQFETSKTNFRQVFRHPGGGWGTNTPTELALVLELGLAEGAAERTSAAEELARQMEAARFTAQFGLLGAKHVPRALAANGYIDHAWSIFTQPEYPGWVHWLRQGATTLWETWEGNSSRNHIMFGDFPAFAFEYLGGIRLDECFAATGTLTLRPVFPSGLKDFSASLQTPYGSIAVHWCRKDGIPEVSCRVDGGIRVLSAERIDMTSLPV